jgi:voltage-gated potassium channel
MSALSLEEAESEKMASVGNVGYQLFMLGLSVFVIAALAAQAFFDLSAESIDVLDTADFAICLIFACDFLNSLSRSKNRFRYMITWGWVDLISSIPTIDIFRWGRSARIFRIIRVFRVLRAARNLSSMAFAFRKENALWSALLLAIIFTISGSVAILQLEVVPSSNIQDADDALWWSIVTITTVGYGDHFPVTPGGKILAFALMAIGIGLFGTLTAVIASKFIAADQNQAPGEIQELSEKVEALRMDIRELISDPLSRHDPAALATKESRPPIPMESEQFQRS